MFEDVELKMKKKNKILFSCDSVCLQNLAEQIKLQNRRTLVMWALNCSKTTLEKFESKYPNEQRPRIALDLCDKWSKGMIKMPIAKKTILDSHAVAKELNDKVYSDLCHAVGHACATIHVKTHAIGLPIYELTSIVFENEKRKYEKAVFEKINYYERQLLYWQENTDHDRLWANFLLNDNEPNK